MPDYPNLRPWKPGQTGNVHGLGGRPLGSRTAFSEGYIRDFALVWAEEGIEAIRKVAKKSPEAFVAIAQRLIPSDVRLSLEEVQPSLTPEVIDVFKGIAAAIPNADSRSPGDVAKYVEQAIRAFDATIIEASSSSKN
jgi:hypothetical protein